MSNDFNAKKSPRNYPLGATPQHLTAGVTTEQSRLPIAYFTANNGKSQTILTQKKVPETNPFGAMPQSNIGGNEVFQPQLHSTLRVVVFLT